MILPATAVPQEWAEVRVLCAFGLSGGAYDYGRHRGGEHSSRAADIFWGGKVMTRDEKNAAVMKIADILEGLVEDTPPKTAADIFEGCEMLTVKECTEVIKGVSEHTIRVLVARGEIKSIRTGYGQKGKLLVSKKSLIDYFGRLC